jgi:diguanylate cyclase (GGDEF)-like protein
MIKSIRKRTVGWLPTVVVLAIVLIAGSRLIYLSVQHHAALAREAAAAVAATFARKIEPPLQNLADLAGRQAASPAQSSSHPPASTSASLPPAGSIFWMTANDKVLSVAPDEAATASGIASEWQSAEAASAMPGASILGPMRLGSQWLVAIRVPDKTSPSRGWSVAYADLDELIADSHLTRLTDMGYDFELAQVEPRSARPRIFVSSNSDALIDAVGTRIRLPAAAALPGSYLQVSIRPHAGWFPASLLTSEMALLAFLAWLLAFGTHDLIHALQRSREALANVRRRLGVINQQLAGEMQRRLNLQETLDHARFHDAFTGLPNRRFFMDQLDRALREVRAKRRQRIAVIIVDIARFKLINDMLGQTAGDELMVQVARRFEKSASAFEGVLARWSGDQFAVLILEVPSVEAPLEIAGLLQAELRSPFELRRHKLIVGATFGITCADSGQKRAEEVVMESDIALSVAKRNETAKIVLYAPNMTGQAADIVSLEADLHVALERHQLQLLFQPIVDLRTYTMVGGEALLRWHHPVEGVLEPGKFLRIAEESGLMVPITRWIILKVVETATKWLRRLPANQKFYFSVNLSATALRDPGLSEYTASVLAAKQVPPSLLKFELTEAALIGNVGAARETLDSLHSMGVQLMLDDFGTGYSSLSNLQLFPFDFVKIDRPFVNSTGSDQANASMIGAMVQIAGSLKLTAIAEIIETETAAKALQAMGCKFGQGYYFSEPIEEPLALQWLRTQQPFQAPPTASPTIEDQPPVEDSSPTMTLETIADPDRRPPAKPATPKLRPNEEDNSPTIMIPSSDINFTEETEPESE